MPRVDPGWIAVDLPLAKRLGFNKVLELVQLEGAILVLKPSLITVKSNSHIITIALSPGSVLLPPGSELVGWTLSRPEWINGCLTYGRGNSIKLLQNNSKVFGKVISRDIEDPIALLVNGKPCDAWKYSLEEWIPIAYIGNYPILWRNDTSYATSISDSQMVEILDFTVRLYTNCGGR